MNKLLIFLLTVVIATGVQAQKEYFVYLQSEENKPFYVRMNEKTYSSSSSGYLILSKMRDSSHTFRVGWPSGGDDQVYFTVPVAGRDRGFLLKNFPGQGWGLFDLQNLELLKSHGAPAEKGTVRMEPKEVSAFTDVLSRAANDPSLRMQEVRTIPPQPALVNTDSLLARATEEQNRQAESSQVKSEPARVDTVDARADSTVPNKDVAIKEEEVAIKVEENIAEPAAPAQRPAVDSIADLKKPEQELLVAEKEDSTAMGLSQPTIEKPLSFDRSTVTRKSESSTTEGFSLIFEDRYADGRIDTVKITIPNSRLPWQQEEQKKPVAEERKFLDIPVSAADSVPVLEKKQNDCRYQATESDFLKLRRQMASETTDDGMIREARKAFVQKCYSVKQVRNLGALFLNDAARFQFFEAAQNHVSDLENFPGLGEELKNEYYLRRFKGLIR